MTKAEAFEWLKCKKVSVSTREMGRKVQSKLFACGVQWRTGGTDFCDYGNYYVINSHGLLGFCDGPYYECLINEEISADDILSIEIVDGEDNIAEKNAFQQARDIMKWLREEQSPHTLMIIDGYHVELLDGVKAEVWKE